MTNTCAPSGMFLFIHVSGMLVHGPWSYFKNDIAKPLFLTPISARRAFYDGNRPDSASVAREYARGSNPEVK